MSQLYFRGVLSQPILMVVDLKTVIVLTLLNQQVVKLSKEFGESPDSVTI